MISFDSRDELADFSLREIEALGKFTHTGPHVWQLISDRLGWKLYRDGLQHRVYAIREGVREDILKDICE